MVVLVVVMVVLLVVLLVVVVMLVVVQNRPDTAQLTKGFIFSQGVVCPLHTWKMVIGAVFGGLEG